MAASFTEWFTASSSTGWVERMILQESLDHPVSTAEYLDRHNLGLHRKAGHSVDLEPGEGADSLSFLDRERSEREVREALASLERNGFVERTDPPAVADGGEWWRLTDTGRKERARLREEYKERLESLRFEYGITDRW